MRSLMALVTAMMAALLLGGCAAEQASSPEEPATATVPSETDGAARPDATAEEAEPRIAWLDTELTDAVTGKTFRLSDYKGKPVLLHSFAVW